MQFPHLSFLEYFAGHGLLASSSPSKAPPYQVLEQFLQQYRYHPRYSVALRFMMGETVRQAPATKYRHTVRRILQLLDGPPREVAGLQHLTL